MIIFSVWSMDLFALLFSVGLIGSLPTFYVYDFKYEDNFLASMCFGHKKEWTKTYACVNPNQGLEM